MPQAGSLSLLHFSAVQARDTTLAVLILTTVVVALWIILRRALFKEWPHRRIVSKAGVLLLGLLLLVFATQRLERWLDPFAQQRFSTAQWSAVSQRDPERRGPMARSLVQDHLKRGMTRQAVHALLGLPDRPSLPGREHLPEGWGNEAAVRTEEYALGAWSGARIDYDYLSVAYDAQDRLVTAWIWQS